MLLEVREESEEYCEGEFEDLRYGGDAVLGQRHAQILLDGIDEHLVGFEDRSGILQDREQQLQRQDLGSQLMGSRKKQKKKY